MNTPDNSENEFSFNTSFSSLGKCGCGTQWQILQVRDLTKMAAFLNVLVYLYECIQSQILPMEH